MSAEQKQVQPSALCLQGCEIEIYQVSTTQWK